MQVSHWLTVSGTVPKATFRKAILTTATCSDADSATAAQSQGLVNRFAKALVVSDLALKHCSKCAITSTVKPAVRAVTMSPSPSISSISPPGRYMSIVSRATTAMTTPISNTPAHMWASITRSLM